MAIEIDPTDDFGDSKIDALATKYRNALQDIRPAFGNLYLLENVKPLSKKVKDDLSVLFNLAIENNEKIKLEDVDRILSSELTPKSLY